jgi:hypothetical protein
MKPSAQGNGSGKFDIDQVDMGGWVRICPSGDGLPPDLPLFLSQALTDWFRARPNLRLRCVMPVDRDGNTVELHAWYDAHLFAPLEGPRPMPKNES